MDYKQNDFSSTAWQRCRSVTISNPHPASGHPMNPQPPHPIATFEEEQVFALPDGKFVFTSVGSCSKAFDPAAAFPILDPSTGLPTGQTFTQGVLYVILYSLYMQTAIERDAQIVADALAAQQAAEAKAAAAALAGQPVMLPDEGAV